MTNTNATPEQITINTQINFGLTDFANTLLLNYQEPNTTTCLFQLSQNFIAVANTVNQVIDLATMFSSINTAVLYGIVDISNPGQQVNIGMASSGSRFNMNPGGFFLVRANGSSPTLFVDNPSSSVNAILQVFCLAN